MHLLDVVSNGGMGGQDGAGEGAWQRRGQGGSLVDTRDVPDMEMHLLDVVSTGGREPGREVPDREMHLLNVVSTREKGKGMRKG